MRSAWLAQSTHHRMGGFAMQHMFTEEHDGAHPGHASDEGVQGFEHQMMQALLSSLYLQESAISQGLISAPNQGRPQAL